MNYWDSMILHQAETKQMLAMPVSLSQLIHQNLYKKNVTVYLLARLVNFSA